MSDDKTFLTRAEADALAVLLNSSDLSKLSAPDEVHINAVTTIKLEIISVTDDEIPTDLTVCLDFGTAYSKAFATKKLNVNDLEFIDLAIGGSDSNPSLLNASEILITKEFIYFGARARDRLNDSHEDIGRLIDSIKQFITLNTDVSKLNLAQLDEIKDPCRLFSRRDALLLYLAHLMSRTETKLVERGFSINARRRFTHPAWRDAARKINESEMRVLMAQAIVLARSAPDRFRNAIEVAAARKFLDDLSKVELHQLPVKLIAEPVREATAAGAGAISATPERSREAYLVVDIGAGTTDVAGFICVNNPKWDRARLFEIIGAADAKNTAGNVLDNTLQKYILEKSSLTRGSEEHYTAGMAIRRSIRVYKETLFNSGTVTVALPTDEAITIDLKLFMSYPPVIEFERTLVEMIAKAASVVADHGRIWLVPTGGGATLPLVMRIAEEGVKHEERHINFALADATLAEVRQSRPDLVSVYPQISVALGGSFPFLPEERPAVSSGTHGNACLLYRPNL